MVDIAEIEKPAQLPEQFLWSRPITGPDKNTVYERVIKIYPWWDVIPRVWVRSVMALYFAVDFNSAGQPIDARVKPE